MSMVPKIATRQISAKCGNILLYIVLQLLSVARLYNTKSSVWCILILIYLIIVQQKISEYSF